MKKISKKHTRIVAIAVIVLAVAGLASWTLIGYQNEQARLKQLRVETENKQVANKVVKETYEELFKKLRAGGTFTIEELVNGSHGKYIDEKVKNKLLQQKDPTPLLGCRDKLSDQLIASGFMFEVPNKTSEYVYTVGIIWKGDSADSSDRPSVGRADINIKSVKIVGFDCSEQDAINVKRQENVNAEMKAR